MRVFAAVPLPNEVRQALVERIAGLDIPGKLAPPENWHLTLRFLGAVDDVTFDRFLAGLAPVEEVRSFRVRLTGYGAFPNPRRSTVVWTGVDEGVNELTRLNEMAEEAAQAAGLSPEERPYHPHVTLSRVRPPANSEHLLGEDLDLAWRCDRVVVYESRLGGGTARYEPLETFDLFG
jgi:2'-5' RNA ligase